MCFQLCYRIFLIHNNNPVGHIGIYNFLLFFYPDTRWEYMQRSKMYKLGPATWWATPTREAQERELHDRPREDTKKYLHIVQLEEVSSISYSKWLAPTEVMPCGWCIGLVQNCGHVQREDTCKYFWSKTTLIYPQTP